MFRVFTYRKNLHDGVRELFIREVNLKKSQSMKILLLRAIEKKIKGIFRVPSV